MEQLKGRDVAFVSDWLTKNVFRRSLLETGGADDDCSLVGYDRRYGRAFQHQFGPRGIQSSKVQMPGLFPDGGGGGMLKFRVDRRITLTDFNMWTKSTLIRVRTTQQYKRFLCK